MKSAVGGAPGSSGTTASNDDDTLDPIHQTGASRREGAEERMYADLANGNGFAQDGMGEDVAASEPRGGTLRS